MEIRGVILDAGNLDEVRMLVEELIRQTRTDRWSDGREPEPVPPPHATGIGERGQAQARFQLAPQSPHRFRVRTRAKISPKR